ncbi:MAG: neutral amino acid transport system ATP-binding protein [Thermoplasmata archaeon]|jgi:ABC-type branched-subunit amino acid transport system ATPase component|nr:neutral amino acid transport system ATP-binding protein [Thermoplasmata archaeon]
MPDPVLSAEGIVAGYGELNILQGASVEVYEGELVCILGPNGAGKSTMLKAIAGLLKPRGGTVALLGKEITGHAPDKLVGEGLAYVPQVANVFPTMTVDENLDMGAYLLPPAEIPEAKRRVHELFPVLRERAAERVGRMSGGQRQMVAIGRALMTEPAVLLLDEPSAGLAPNLQDLVFAQARAIADAGTPILLVEQNAKKALLKSDRGYVLDQGKNAYTGTGAELLHDPNVGKLYLGDRPT